MKKKKIEHICGNCKLFNSKKLQCSVVILFEGKRVKIPVDPEDSCFFEGQYFDPTTKAMEDFAENIQEVKFWVENDKGEKIDGDGKVFIQYPNGFFGPEKDPESDNPDLDILD